MLNAMKLRLTDLEIDELFTFYAVNERLDINNFKQCLQMARLINTRR